jgi:Bacterial protein of unknown function (DUF882)
MTSKPIATLVGLALAALVPAVALAAETDGKPEDGTSQVQKKPKHRRHPSESAPGRRATSTRRGRRSEGASLVPVSLTVPVHAAGKPAKAEKACMKAPVIVSAGREEERFVLAKCDGTPAPLAVEYLSLLARPASAQRPAEAVSELARSSGSELAPGIRRVDPRLLERLAIVAEHFGKKGKTTHVQLISGYRPTSAGSYHSTARALDFRIEGAKNEDVVAFCKTLPDTGCGYYPNSLFVHMDVRDHGAGHVSWIDASGPGESPRYVAEWPAAGDAPHDKKARESATAVTRLDRELPPLPPDEHPATAAAMVIPVR